MNNCPECGLPQELTVDPKAPDHLILWSVHVRGCSHSPMVEPTQTIQKWRMRSVRRTDSPTQPDPARRP